MKTIPLVLFLVIFLTQLKGQDRALLFQQADELQKNHKQAEALAIFKALLKNDSTNVELLNRVSYLLAYPGYPGKPKAEREKIYNEAYYLASKSVRLDPKSAYGYYHIALALGRLSENASTNVKIANARQIRQSCEKAIKLNPHLPGPYHILARWHREVAGFNMIEKAMIATFFGGGLEGGSFEEALKNFKTSLKMDPYNPVHHYEIALTYYERNTGRDREIAKDWLKKALSLKVYDDSGKRVLAKAEGLLKKL